MTKRARKPVETRKPCARGNKFIERNLKSEGMIGDKGAKERWTTKWFEKKDMHYRAWSDKKKGIPPKPKAHPLFPVGKKGIVRSVKPCAECGMNLTSSTFNKHWKSNHPGKPKKVLKAG